MSRPRIAAAVVVGAAVAALAVAVTPSNATYSGKNGRIAFRRYFNDAHNKSAIFTIQPDGSGETRITHPPKGFFDDQPDWSPDGSLIAFTRCPANSGSCAVYVVRANGSGLRRLSPPCPPKATPPQCEDDANVTFLPDGRHVAFTRATGNVRHWKDSDQIQHSDIVVSDLNGGHRQVVLRSREYGGDYDFAYFSPDGRQFVYERANSPLSKPAGHHALFVASRDGADDHRITPWTLDAGDNPDWSPDGNWILFRTHEDADKNTNIAIVHPNGSGLRQLTHFAGPVNMRSATFSPDGQSIVLASDLGKGGNPAVYTMDLHGTHIQLVSHSKLWDSAVDWGTHP
jgi:Tol biopolymer transport system component